MYTLKVLLEDKNNSYAYFNKMFFIKFKIQNIFISYVLKQIKKLKYDEEYIKARKQYGEEKSKNTPNKNELKKISEVLNYKISYYGLTKSNLEKYSKRIQKKYKKYIGSQVAQVIANDVYVSVEKYLYSDGKFIHFKKLEDIHSISAKSIKNGIKVDVDKNVCIFNKFECRFIIKDYNSYLKECFEKDKENIKFCRLVREPFNNGYRYYIQFVIDSEPILKFTKGTGSCGIDHGVSSIAATTDSSCILDDLAPEIEKYNKKIINVQKKMERSQRLNNKENYKEDGTIKKGCKFKKSKNYKHLRKIYKSLNRKRNSYIKQNQEKLANRIIKETDSIFYEEMNFKSLGKRAKNTERSEKVSEVKSKSGTKLVHKFKRKKRFGKTLKNKAPGQFLEILKRKCSFYNIPIIPINTKEFKASQYNHIFDDYRKKELKDRWNYLYDKDFEPIFVQRDLYSSFLIKNTNKDLNHPDRNKCLKDFDRFLELHNRCIEEVIENNKNRLSCFGF